jgi:hypothetical protein
MTMTKALGLAAVAGLLAIAAPAPRVEASSLLNPGIAAAVQGGVLADTTEVRWHRGWHRHYGFRRHYGHRRHWRRW